jgi:hypothetical protein
MQVNSDATAKETKDGRIVYYDWKWRKISPVRYYLHRFTPSIFWAITILAVATAVHFYPIEVMSFRNSITNAMTVTLP